MIWNQFLHTLCTWSPPPPFSVPLTRSPPFCEISSGTLGTVGDLWLTLSTPLSGAGKARRAAACIWMTVENQSHYASQPRPLHSGHYRLHLAPWFMDAILAPERDMKGSLEVEGREGWMWFPRPAFWPKIILKGTCRRCISYAYVWVKKRMCVSALYSCAWICVGKCHLSFCQEVFCTGVDSAYCWKQNGGTLTLKVQSESK